MTGGATLRSLLRDDGPPCYISISLPPARSRQRAPAPAVAPFSTVRRGRGTATDTARPRTMSSVNSFGSRATLDVAGAAYTIYRLDALSKSSKGNSDRLPFSLKILLENLLRNEDGAFVKKADIEAMASWDVKGRVEKEIAFRTARVLLQDFTGVPAVVDLAAMRDALSALGGNPQQINPLQP